MTLMMPGISRDAVREAVADAIRAFVGHGRHVSFDQLAADTGDEVRTLRSYVEAGGPMAPLDALLRIAAALTARGCGAQFLTRITGIAGLTCAHVDDVDADANVRQALASVTRIASDISEEIIDGQLCGPGRTRIAQSIRDQIPILVAAADDGRAH